MATRQLPNREVEQTIDAQALIQARLAEQAVQQTHARLGVFSAWYDNAQVAKLGLELAQIVSSAQKISAQSTDAYVTRLSGLLSGKTIRAAGQIKVDGLRRGTHLDRVYQRLARDFRYQVSKDKPADRALQIVSSRAAAMVHTDVQLASRQQAQVSMKQQGNKAWRRVIHPELSRGGVCGLCAVASDRVYHVDELMAIHDGCHCQPVMLDGSQDFGYELNKADLATIYGEAGGTGADELKRVKYKVHHHGELGPILTNSKYDWRTPKDVAA